MNAKPLTGVRVLTPDVARVPEPGAPAAEELELASGDGKVTVKGGTRFAVPPDQPEFEQVARRIHDIQDMIPALN